jgi:hypothetical protein
MRTWRATLPAALLLTLISTAFVACDRSRSASPDDSTSTSVSGGAGSERTEAIANSGWDASAGALLVLPTVDGGMVAGSLLRPEATELTVADTVGVGAAMGDRRVELFARSGKIGSALLSVEAAPRTEAGCTAWPVARLAIDGGSVATPWTAAFMAGRVTPVPLDSIEGLAVRDSARLAADLTRLASGLPDDTSQTFRTLPYVVLRAWRTASVDSGFVVATLVRRVNQEDAPKEERLVVVVNTGSADATTWKVAWHERASGHEEELVVAEPLLAFRTTRSADLHLLFGRDDGIALGAAVLTRVAGTWRVLWESAVAGCD